MRMYGIERQRIPDKYSSEAAAYYRKRLSAQAMGRQDNFNEQAPSSFSTQAMSRLGDNQVTQKIKDQFMSIFDSVKATFTSPQRLADNPDDDEDET